MSPMTDEEMSGEGGATKDNAIQLPFPLARVEDGSDTDSTARIARTMPGPRRTTRTMITRTTTTRRTSIRLCSLVSCPDVLSQLGVFQSVLRGVRSTVVFQSVLRGVRITLFVLCPASLLCSTVAVKLA